MTFAISIGEWGGFYVSLTGSWRICLGWIAFTIFPWDIDETLALLVTKVDELTVDNEQLQKDRNTAWSLIIDANEEEES